MFVKPKFLPHSHVLLHVQLCVRPLWSADRPEPEYQQIQSRGELATWLQHNFFSARRKNRPGYMSRCRWRQRWEWCAWSPAWSTWQTSSSASHRFSSWKQTFHYHSLFFSLTQRRKFLDDRGYWTVLPWFFHTEKAEINISALILKDYPHSTVNLRPLALSRLTKDRE